FSFRLARKGYRLVFAPKAIVLHQHDKGMGEYIRRKFGIGYWKAFMLRWLPEKTFKDSHTPGSLRWQILFLALTLGIAALVGIFWSPGWWLIFTSLAVFYLTALPFLGHIRWEDPEVLLISPLMLLLRAGALGFGLVKGFIVPPRAHPRKYTGLSFPKRFLKRGLDIIGALIGLTVFSPVLALAAVAIKLDSSGPVIFSQERAGENGVPFQVLKLRTMFLGSEERVNEILDQNSLEGPVYKIPNDPRVTRVGRFLRRWSFDEIPQFWNVLRGEMSLVGPRPEETWVVSQYNDHQRQRLAIKPGLTGPMQVGGRGELDMDERLALELDYINNYSVWVDLSIIFRTIPAVISGKGAF
ncbi:MAG: sugar transferase, partial [Anaerolineae bacterium]|nr:sugar transferase [Anaerolineae bacterium]